MCFIFWFKFLKAKIKNCIEKDDDILTQFVEADFLKYKIETSIDFAEIIEMKKGCGKPLKPIF